MLFEQIIANNTSLQPYEYISTEITENGNRLVLLSVSIYMNSRPGLSSFDSVPTMISSKLHLPFFAVRMCWDFTAILIGTIAGGALTIGTVILAFTIGPAVSFIGRIMFHD